MAAWDVETEEYLETTWQLGVGGGGARGSSYLGIHSGYIKQTPSPTRQKVRLKLNVSHTSSTLEHMFAYEHIFLGLEGLRGEEEPQYFCRITAFLYSKGNFLCNIHLGCVCVCMMCLCV